MTVIVVLTRYVRFLENGDAIIRLASEATARHDVLIKGAASKEVAALALAEREVWEVPDHPESLGAAQRAAVEAVSRAGFTVLPGGPGTGKSTVVAQVLALAERNGVETLLAAPTGRAAKRLEQLLRRGNVSAHGRLRRTPDQLTWARAALASSRAWHASARPSAEA